MTFRQAILEASFDASITKKQKASIQAASDNAADHPLLWKAAQAFITHRYQRETGKTIGANFDWSTILQWLVKNLPAIITLLLGIFGA